MNKKKHPEALVGAAVFVAAFFGLLAMSTVVITIKDLIMQSFSLLPRDVIALVCAVPCIILMRWMIRLTVKTYYILLNDKIVLSRYIIPKGEKQTYLCSEVVLSHVEAYGFTTEFKPDDIESSGTLNRYGFAGPQEICFVLQNGEIVPWATVSYSSKRVREVCGYIKTKTGIEPSGLLKKRLYRNHSE